MDEENSEYKNMNNQATVASLPLILAAVSSIIIFFFGKLFLNSRKRKNEISLRGSLMESYVAKREVTAAKAKIRGQLTRKAVESLGNQVVSGQYSQRLKKMLVNSGDWENKNYSTLVRRKSFLAIGGFSIVFFLLIINNIETAPLVIAGCLTFYYLPNIPYYFRKALRPSYVAKLEKLLDKAGSNNEGNYIILVKQKLIFAAAGFAISYLYLLVSSKSISSFFYTVIAVVLGFFLPDLLLQNKVLKRKQEIADALPDSLDMLQMCVGAGLAFPAALARVAETQTGPIAEEFTRVTTEVQFGKSRSEALAGMAERTQEKSVEKFVNAMLQVSTFGIPILNVITEQAKDMRNMRREKARERAQKVPVKVLGPIMIFFLPSVLIIIIGPAIVNIFTGLG